MSLPPPIPGARAVAGWFGQWPSFHDAEVVSIALDRAAGARIVVRHSGALVTFVLSGFPLDHEGVALNRIQFFNHQNVLSSLALDPAPFGWNLVLDGIFGVSASIACHSIHVQIAPA